MDAYDTPQGTQARHSTAVLYDAGCRLGLGISLRGLAPLTANRRLYAPASTVKFAHGTIRLRKDSTSTT